MATLAKNAGKFLNSTQNPNIAISKLEDRLTNLRSNLSNSLLFVPTLDEKFLTLVSNYTVTPISFYRTLTTSSIIGGKKIKSGFSTYAITDKLRSNPIYLLDSITGDYSTYYEVLKSINRTYTLPLYPFEDYTIIFGDIYNSYQMRSFSSWTVPSSVFHHIYLQDDYNSADISNYNSIVLMLMYFFIYKCLSRSTDFTSQLFNYINDNDLLLYTDFRTSFSNYISTNKSSMASTLTTYLLNSVFNIIGNDVLFETTVESEVEDLLDHITDSFDTVFTETFISIYITREFCNLTAQFMLSYNAIDFVMNHFYDNRSTYWLTNDSELSSVETDFVTNLRSILTTNLYNLEVLEYVSLQFKTEPLFFINSYIYNHANWVSLMLEDITAWMVPTSLSSPDVDGRSINSGAYSWVLSSVGTDMYYLTFNDSISDIIEPVYVYQEHAVLTKTTNTTLSQGQWSYADLDSLGDSTIYIRLILSGDTTYDPNPNNHDEDYIIMSPVLTVRDLLKMMPLIGLWGDGGAQGSSLIADYIVAHPLNFSNSGAGTLASYLTFCTMINSFFESDDFKSYIIDYFMQSVYDKIREKVAIQFSIAEHVDEVVSFLKTMFFDDMINNSKLFANLISTFNAACQYVVNNTMTQQITSTTVKNIALDEYNFVNSYSNVVNSFYLSSITVEYLINTLRQYEI
jgi:hypothetical protein